MELKQGSVLMYKGKLLAVVTQYFRNHYGDAFNIAVMQRMPFVSYKDMSDAAERMQTDPIGLYLIAPGVVNVAYSGDQFDGMVHALEDHIPLVMHHHNSPAAAAKALMRLHNGAHMPAETEQYLRYLARE